MHIERIQDKSVLTVRDHLPAACIFGAQRRLAECHGFEHGHAPGIGATGRNKNIGVPIEVAKFLIRNRAHLINNFVQLMCFDRGAQLLLLFSAAGKNDRELPNTLADQQTRCVEEIIPPFAWANATDI